ncbi:D-alanyl-D-alanine carboxypeptidase [Opitutaceae bacterium EW11]|nr:D-alanyl-D-alanine carboxypeptidase [Opitutaceae bacterium EW11]
MSPRHPDYPARISALLVELGIPIDYPMKRHLPLQPEAASLESVGPDDAGRDCLLIAPAAEAWRSMRAAAAKSGVVLIPLSGFRSVERQTEIVRGKLALGEKVEHVLQSIAAPGYSEHHTGRAIDVGTPGVLPLEEVFVTTAAYAWLARHAGEFGFHMSYPRRNPHGFVFEPWHWCWRA